MGGAHAAPSTARAENNALHYIYRTTESSSTRSYLSVSLIFSSVRLSSLCHSSARVCFIFPHPITRAARPARQAGARRQ